MAEVDLNNERRKGITDYVRYLEMRIQELEAEVTYLRREVSYYKQEIEKLLSTPLIEGVVLEVLEDGRAIVKLSLIHI